MKIDTPNNIDVLLHYHVSSSVHERFDAPAVQDAVDKLQKAGAIEPAIDAEGKMCRGYYQTTPLGKAWIKALCNTEIPKIAYVDANGNVL